MNGEADLLKRRFCELAQNAERRGLYTYSGFLSLYEQSVLQTLSKSVLSAPFSLNGGAPGCERQIARFGSPDQIGYLEPFPIECVQIMPTSQRFSEALVHRDYLGAVMSLGIVRDRVGDLCLNDSGAVLFCASTVAPYLAGELTKVRNTPVRCLLLPETPSPMEPKRTPQTVQVSSLRLDGLIARAYGLSREESSRLFLRGQVFVNGAPTERGEQTPREGQIISVRGYGRFLFVGEAGTTRKGRLNVLIEKYEG